MWPLYSTDVQVPGVGAGLPWRWPCTMIAVGETVRSGTWLNATGGSVAQERRGVLGLEACCVQCVPDSQIVVPEHQEAAEPLAVLECLSVGCVAQVDDPVAPRTRA